MRSSVLVVDDDQSFCELLEDDLTLRRFDVAWRTRPEEAVLLLGERDFDVVLSDVNMPGTDGIEFCRQVVGMRPELPVVILTAFGSMESAVDAMRAGAQDFVTKPIDMAALAATLERAIQQVRSQQRVRRLTAVGRDLEGLGSLLGSSPAMRKLFDRVERLAGSAASVLIYGESGTGKELVARALHDASGRKGRFVAINCSALPGPLLESELFGHEEGAFTDARTKKRGLFLEADQGTLFLDEIGDFPLELQPKILRALEERRIRPVGGAEEIEFHASILAATNVDLEAAVEEGRFRGDLFYRINVVQIDMPPLRERAEDILELANHFLQQFAKRLGKPVQGISPAAAQRILWYHWPGNVRELQNCLECAVSLTRHEEILVEDLPPSLTSVTAPRRRATDLHPSNLLPLEEVERNHILDVLDALGGNKSETAKLLGVDRKTLYRKLRRYREGPGASRDAGEE